MSTPLWKTVGCPVCKRLAGKTCGGAGMQIFHPERMVAARVAEAQRGEARSSGALRKPVLYASADCRDLDADVATALLPKNRDMEIAPGMNKAQPRRAEPSDYIAGLTQL